MLYTNAMHLCVEDRHSLLRSCSFNGALWDVFGPLLNGAGVFHYGIRDEGMAGLAGWLTREGITICNFVTSVFRHFAHTLTGAERFPELRILFAGAELVNETNQEPL